MDDAEQANGKRRRFIVLEGLPGSGKTTLGEQFEARGWKLLSEISTTLSASEGLGIGDQADGDTDKKIFAAEWPRIERIQKLLDEGASVVVDGYLPTTLAFAHARQQAGRASSYDEILAAYREALAEGRIPRPTIYVRIRVPTSMALERQTLRGQKGPTPTTEIRTLKDVEEQFDLIHAVFEPDVPVFVVDGAVAPETNADAIENAIRKNGL